MDNPSLTPKSIILLITTLTLLSHLVKTVDSVTTTKFEAKRTPGNRNKNVLGIVNLNPNTNHESLEMMANRPPCSSSFHIHSNYKPRGMFEKIGNISVYTAGSLAQHHHPNPNFESNVDPETDWRFNSNSNPNSNSNYQWSASSSSFSSLPSQTVLIDLYDIFGLHPNYLQVSDKLASDTGYKVIVPDLFQGFVKSMMMNRNQHQNQNQHQQLPEPRQQRDYKSNDMDLLIPLTNYWEKRMKHDLIMLMNYYKNNFGIRSFGLLGFSQGGTIALRATSELSHMGIKAAALVYPSTSAFPQMRKNHMEIVASIKAPLFLMPSRDEPDMLPFYMELQKKFGLSCGHRRFEDMSHGFAGSQGNFDDPLTQERIEEVISLLKEFFQKNISYN